MSLHLGIRRTRKHRAVDAVTSLRDENRRLLGQLIGAHDHIALLESDLAQGRAKQAEAEQVVVCLSADLDERTEERNQLAGEVTVLRARLAPYLAADANRDALTIPPAERDTSNGADQATAPIDVRPLWEAHGISPVIRIADSPSADDPRTPTWVPGTDDGPDTTQTFRIIAA